MMSLQLDLVVQEAHRTVLFHPRPTMKKVELRPEFRRRMKLALLELRQFLCLDFYLVIIKRMLTYTVKMIVVFSVNF